jgi:hypothetical protein
VFNYKGSNEGTNSVRSNRRWSTPGDIGSIIIISPKAYMSRADPAWIIPVVTNVFVDYPTENSTHLTMGMRFKNFLHGEKRKFEFIKSSTIFHLLRILGLMAVLSYMIVILFTWAYANHQGYVYFSAGEPVSLIKYPEWALGILGILATASILRRELDRIKV